MIFQHFYLKLLGKYWLFPHLLPVVHTFQTRIPIRLVWYGPVGVFEFDQFGEGTKAIAMAIAKTKAFTLAGGGDTIAAIQKYNIYDKVSYISTAGGAFLEFLEGKTLPAVEILEQRAAK